MGGSENHSARFLSRHPHQPHKKSTVSFPTFFSQDRRTLFPPPPTTLLLNIIKQTVTLLWPPVQLEASLLPDAPVCTWSSQLRFGVWAQGAPRVLGAGLHDRARGRPHRADIGCLPQLAHQAV